MVAAVGKVPGVPDYIEREREHREQMLNAFGGSPALEVVTSEQRLRQREILASFGRVPAIEGVAQQQREFQQRLLSTFGRSLALQAFKVQQHERYRLLLADFGRSAAVGDWSVTLPPGFADQLATYKRNLLADIASRLPADPEEVEGDVGTGAEAWARLAAEREAILTCLDRTAKIMVAAKMAGVPLPTFVVVMLLIFVVLGEVADEILQERQG